MRRDKGMREMVEKAKDNIWMRRALVALYGEGCLDGWPEQVGGSNVIDGTARFRAGRKMTNDPQP